MNEWWTGAQAGVYIGAIGGSGVGMLGGLVGVLCGFLVPKGKGKTLIMSLLGLMFVIGVATLAAGIYAVIIKQPYHVWYGLVLLGVISTISTVPLLVVIPKMFRQVEARRLAAQEFRAGTA